MPDLVGFEFVQTVGKGAMGAVYLARQTALNRYVAVKQILGAYKTRDRKPAFGDARQTGLLLRLALQRVHPVPGKNGKEIDR